MAETLHLGDAQAGMELVVMAATKPAKLREHLRTASDNQLIGLAAHVITLQECVDDVLKVFTEEKTRRGL